MNDAELAKWMPTRKWWVATVTAVGGFLTTWVATGQWTKELSGALITIGTQRVVTYLTPNESTPGGVPRKRRRRSRRAATQH
jgi:hypothetical protein